MKKRFLAVAVATFAIVLIVCLASSVVLAATPPGQRGHEGQPGNQGGHNGIPPGLKGYEGQPGLSLIHI